MELFQWGIDGQLPPAVGSQGWSSPRVLCYNQGMLCELCECEDAYNFHHFIPRTLHSNKWFKRRFTRQQMQQGIAVCKTCHGMIHDLVPDEKELGKQFSTKETLLAHPKVARYVQWKRRKAGKE